MSDNNLKAVVYGRLEAIMAAEKITRVELAALSREILIYVPESNDIDIVNRLHVVLTPMNAQLVVLYFTHFLPWEVEKDNDGKFSRFGKKMSGEKKVNKRLDLIKAWLADENNNLWSWAKDNVDMTKKKDFVGMIQKALEKALKGDEENDSPALSKLECLMAVMSAGFTIDDMLSAVEVKEKLIAEAEVKLAA